MRNVKGITQKQLAAQVGVTERTIISYENNVQDLQKADFIVIHRIAQALNVAIGTIGSAVAWEHTELTMTILGAITTFLGASLGLSSAQFYKDESDK